MPSAFFFILRRDDEITHVVYAIENFSSVKIFHPFATREAFYSIISFYTTSR